jgi:hypothetical protein
VLAEIDVLEIGPERIRRKRGLEKINQSLLIGHGGQRVDEMLGN